MKAFFSALLARAVAAASANVKVTAAVAFGLGFVVRSIL
jgi:hypothetical protein